MYLFCRLKPTSFWWLTVQLMWSCWCLRGCQDRHTTTHVPRGITVPPPLSASASTSKRRSFDKTVVKTRSCYTELVDSFLRPFLRFAHILLNRQNDILIKWRNCLEIQCFQGCFSSQQATVPPLLCSCQLHVCTTWTFVHLVPTIATSCQILSHWEHTEVYSGCCKTIFVLLYTWQSWPQLLLLIIVIWFLVNSIVFISGSTCALLDVFILCYFTLLLHYICRGFCVLLLPVFVCFLPV